MSAALKGSGVEAKLLQMIGSDLLQTSAGFGRDTDLFQVGLDSMAIMQLLLLVEEEFGVVIPVESVSRENFKTTRAVAALIRERGGMEAEDEGEETVSVEPIGREEEQKEALKVEEMSAAFDRLPLRPADFFVVGFDQLLRGHGQMGHIAHSFLELESVPDVGALRRLIAELPKVFPLLNARLKRSWLVGLPRWVPAGRLLELELKLWSQKGSAGRLKAEGAVEFDDLQLLLEDAVNKTLRRERDGWVNAGFELIEKADGGVVLVFSWSHLIFDGVGAELFLQEMDRLLKGEVQQAIPPYVTSEPVKTLPWGERFKAVEPMIKRFYAIMEKRFECLGSRQFVPGRTRFEVLTLTKEQTAEVQKRSTAVSGPLINMPFHLACAMRAHWRVFDHRGESPGSLMCCVPVQVRRKGARGPVFQNQLTMFFGTVDGEDLKTLDGAARVVQDQHAQFLKDRLDESFQQLMSMMKPMPPKLHMKFIQFQMKGLFTSFYHSNTGPFAPSLDEFLGVKVTNAYHVPGISTPPGTGIFANEKHGRLVLTLCWKEGAMTEEERGIFMEQLLTDLGAK
ncbi:hypothetical protein FEM03_19625 [Phragmitibacter flavus]|uniref:Carrier domain-containing protein n=1 Tax=Phragmitibacter flavus TaxID=2576071 RepID=A0A5R8KBY1_9BACT|nr:acyl carrier protein [Phragmitibacter flavus]TLD69079.1 hypothetical protein FEM03_19625 [Phragmitibacter flavus]